jgi:hypothetical protein
VSLSLADVDLLLDLICTPLPVRSGMDLDLEAQQLRPPRPDINLYFPGSILAAVLLWTAVILLAPRLWHVAVWLWWAL